MRPPPTDPRLRSAPSGPATLPPPLPASVEPPAPSGGRSRWRLVGLGAAAATGCAYVALFDPNGSSALYPRCPFNAITGLDCPGCGITRALHALASGDVVRALDHNLLFILALPVIAWLLVRWAVRGIGRTFPGPEPRWRPWMTVAAVVLLGSFWVVRNLPGLDWLAATAG